MKQTNKREQLAIDPLIPKVYLVWILEAAIDCRLT